STPGRRKRVHHDRQTEIEKRDERYESQETMGRAREDGLYPSSRGAVHQGREDDCPKPRIAEGLTERSRLRHAYAELLHKPSRTKLKPQPSGRTKPGKGPFVEAHQPAETDRGP